MADCTLAPETVPCFVSRGTPHQAAREAPTSEGRKLNTWILPAPHNLLQVLRSFTCPKVGTWGRLFNFPSEGRHAEDFYIWKIRRLRLGLNLRSREPIPIYFFCEVFAVLTLGVGVSRFLVLHTRRSAAVTSCGYFRTACFETPQDILRRPNVWLQ
jgi:hypothetical protein